MQQIVVPTRTNVLQLHDLVLNSSKGRPGILHDQYIDSALERPFTYMRYERVDIHTVAALLIDSLARNHAFNDGNKRTALMTAIFTYAINGIYLEFNQKMNEAFEELVLWVVKEKPPVKEIAQRIKDLTQQYQKGTFGSFIATLNAFLTN